MNPTLSKDWYRDVIQERIRNTMPDHADDVILHLNLYKMTLLQLQGVSFLTASIALLSKEGV